jgi:hypothetical protein
MSKNAVAIHHYALSAHCPSVIQAINTRPLFKPEDNLSVMFKDGKLVIAAAVYTALESKESQFQEIENDILETEANVESYFVIVPTGNQIPYHNRAQLIGHVQMYIVNDIVFPCTSQHEAQIAGQKRLGASVFWIKPKQEKKKKHKKGHKKAK